MKNIGGQAVIEGVMMKSPSGWSVAVREPDGGVRLKTERIKKTAPFFKLPILRGVVALIHAMVIGIRAIEFSGSVAYQDGKEDKGTGAVAMTLSIAAAIILAIVIFKFVPLYAATLTGSAFESVSRSAFLFNLADGVARVVVFLLYVYAIGLWKEMKRIYEYHGAEHKAIYAYEAGEELTVENAKKYKPYHPRCGTSFLLIVMAMSIMVFMIIPQDKGFAEKLIYRLLLIPLVAGVSYEVLRYSARMGSNPLMRLIIAPGLFLQRLTVKEPDDGQIEIALRALKEALRLEESPEFSAKGAGNA
ncbi:MAG: DUF1385 domain-containing protein [Nitrospirae bacterium]|nr:DUF1385 domain-containing protein [Nitrospirota bacterium]